MTLVYAGKGSSHSWTWLADLFESRGILDVRFADSEGFTETLNSTASRVIISGGDGFMIADAIGSHGFAHLKGFIHRGGGYVGVCAGAYLPLHSSIAPFDEFNLSGTKIENIDCAGPPANVSPRVAVAYGNCSIYHPVRGEVAVEQNGRQLLAPIYGGPIFREPDKDRVLFRYTGFTGATEFQIDESLARTIILGKPACVESGHGKGRLLLFGPHLEHPKYREANEAFLRLLGVKTISDNPKELPLTGQARNEILEKSVSDLKVAVLGLENRSFTVGNKLWDGSRFLELITAIEKRSGWLDDKLTEDISSKLDMMRELLIRSPGESVTDSLEGPDLLVEATRLCVDGHFAFMRKNR